jgi:YHS domain-containing protein
MIKFLVFIAAGFLLYKLVVGDRRKKEEIHRKKQKILEKEGVLVKDPICGTYVSKDSDIRVKDENATLYFCSYECRDAYLRKIGATSDSKTEGNQSIQ